LGHVRAEKERELRKKAPEASSRMGLRENVLFQMVMR